jgi:hypothetical protein
MLPTALTYEHIHTALEGLPIQGRIMIRLLLLQYFDVPQDEIEFMAADRPDPRLQSGTRLKSGVVPKDAVQAIVNRIGEYRFHVRRRRERLWLQTEYFRKQIARAELLVSIAERLLTERFGLPPDEVHELKSRARTAVPRPMIRDLESRWDRNEIEEDAFRAKRLAVEYQTLLRRLDRDRKRLDTLTRDFETASRTALQDHEIGHIWGLPAGTLAARKIKYLQAFLGSVQAKIGAVTPSTGGPAPANLWTDSLAILSKQPVERSVAAYDGLQYTEEALLEKLTTLCSGTVSEEVESRLWPELVKSLFGLQRLAAVQSDMDMSPEALEQELIQRVSPTPKVVPVLEDQSAPQTQEDAMRDHVLKSILGEDRRF